MRCKIYLENNSHAVYYAGDTLKGIVEVKLQQTKRIQGVYFIVYGAAKCYWTEERAQSRGSGGNRRTVKKAFNYEGKEVYLDTKTYLLGTPEGRQIKMRNGTYKFDFSCHLPRSLPANFDGSFGHIDYYCKAVIEIPWGFDEDYKIMFRIEQKADLNDEPLLKIPSHSEEIRQYCCLFCTTDFLIFTVTLPFTGFAPGQIIPVTVNYNNKSGIEVLSTKISLKRIIRYKGDIPHRRTNVDIEKIIEDYHDGVDGSSSVEFVKNLKLPERMINTNIKYSNLIQVSYEIKVEAEVPDCHKNAVIIIPITIGSVPLKISQSDYSVSETEINFSEPNTSEQNGNGSTIVAYPDVHSNKQAVTSPAIEGNLPLPPPPPFEEALEVIRKSPQNHVKLKDERTPEITLTPANLRT
ncbi:CLUMA_CG012195, isoform A [Clunio marinus]|uniref:CLUMA_CG012195, isoform A n=1 Tax=Clunio marinus TaxID=568069 RepID=A0A1J1IHS8_9DIPT|nr:CLUMA_CG012195, isoform A [Clunio marinus]